MSLSHDCAVEANVYLRVFQSLAEQLKTKDSAAFEDLVRGHESLLLSPAAPLKPTIPLELQKLCELRWEISQAPPQPTPTRPDGPPDGLGGLV